MSDPKMTERHVAQMEYAIEAAEPEEHAELSEILAFIQRHADGSLRCADSKTEVVVNRQEMENQLRTARLLSSGFARQIVKCLSRWLSTPEQPATERK